ncbi:hypothetical protein AJ87_42605 [Rhizobium yanglingense]|nr:hypothetical protein AJ87_42605 [Rhizobium yanglingense]
MSFQLSFFFLFAVLFTQPALADDRTKVIDYQSLDFSCAVVNEAYVKTHTSETFSVDIQKVETDDSSKPFIALRVSKPFWFRKYSYSKKWTRFDTETWSLKDRDDPKFTDCQLLGDVLLDKVPTKHISARWHQFPFNADIEIWISIAHGRLIRTLRKYDEPRQFSSPSVLELYDYNPASASPPLSTSSNDSHSAAGGS